MRTRTTALKIVDIALAVSITGILLFSAFVALVQPEFWIENVVEITVPFVTYFLLPILIVRISLTDYYLSIQENRKLLFKNVFLKGIYISVFIAVAVGIAIWNTCSGEDCLAAIVGSPSIIVGGSIFSFLLTSVLHSKRKSQLLL
jgi:hypothetical protein